MLEDKLIDRIVQEKDFVTLLHETLDTGGVQYLFLGFTSEEIDLVLVLFHSVQIFIKRSQLSAVVSGVPSGDSG